MVMIKYKVSNNKNIFILNVLIPLFVISLLSYSCAHINKLLENKQSPQQEEVTTEEHEENDSLEANDPSTSTTGTHSTIHVIDANTFRIDLAFPIVWDTMLTVLIRNYNIILVNQESGIITTDWDYSEKLSIRNKITVKIKKLSFKNTEIIFHNSVEKLTVTSIYNWVPVRDTYGEVGRIMNNMAIMLNQPPLKISSRTEGDLRRVLTR